MRIVSQNCSMTPVLVTGYVNPDLDGTAGAFAYAEFLNKTGRAAVAGILGAPHDEAKYVLDRFHIPYPQRIESGEGFVEIILVDASDLNGLEGKIVPEKVVEIIDHRKINEAEKFSNAKVQIELVGAAATLVAEKYMHENMAISLESAILLYAAIISNTLNFKASVTTDRDKDAAAWLQQTAMLPAGFWKELFIAKSDLSGEKLEQRIEDDFAHFTLGSAQIGIAQLEIIGARELVYQRGAEICKKLDQLKQSINLDYIFLNTIDLEENNNYFVANGEPTQKLLTKVLGAIFDDMVAEHEPVLMRKQIVPLLKTELET